MVNSISSVTGISSDRNLTSDVKSDTADIAQRMVSGEKVALYSQNQYGKNMGDMNDAQKQKKIALLQATKEIYEMVGRLSDKLKKLMDPVADLSDSKKEEYDAAVMRKVYAGKKLTPEELRYIQIHHPELYPHVLRVQLQRRTLEEKLKNCDSKKEAQKVFDEMFGMIGTDDPDAAMLMAAYEDAFKEYKDSSDYKTLPVQTEKEVENRRNHAEEDRADESEAVLEESVSCEQVVNLNDEIFSMPVIENGEIKYDRLLLKAITELSKDNM